ncbi:MAG: hypothetical protein HGA45_00645, partial [Chloroflexales bacterium]|nr:hypothetical protein [Chloroflexales bacterium]
MPPTLIEALAAYIPRDRVERLLRPRTQMGGEGVALIADISGFTPLTEALTRDLSAPAALPVAIIYNLLVRILLEKKRNRLIAISYFTAVMDNVVSVVLIYFAAATDIYL